MHSSVMLSILNTPRRKSTKGNKLPEYQKDRIIIAMLFIHLQGLRFPHILYLKFIIVVVSHISQCSEPKTYEETSKNPSWIQANKEINVVMANNTWDLVDLPAQIDKVKLHFDGTLERCKARLVIRGTEWSRLSSSLLSSGDNDSHKKSW